MSPATPSQLTVTPFGSGSDALAAAENFLSSFELNVETEADSHLEAVSYDDLKRIHAEAIAGMNDRCPTFFEAMEWAAGELYGPGGRAHLPENA